MRQAKIYYKDTEAGLLTQHDNGSFTFRYDDLWFSDNSKPQISFSFPKTKQEYHSDHLFPFFFHMLPEGRNKQVVCRHMRIDENDHFGLLINTANYDTIGAVTVRNVNQ